MTDEVPLPGASVPEPAPAQPPAGAAAPEPPAQPAPPGPVWPAEPAAPPAPAWSPPSFGSAPEPAAPPAFGAPPDVPAPSGFTAPDPTPGLTPPGGFPQPGVAPPPGYGPPPYGAPPPYLQSPPPPPRSRKGLVIGLVAGGVVLLLLCCGGAIALIASHKPASGTAAGTGGAAATGSPSPRAKSVSSAEYASTLAALDQSLTVQMTSFAAATSPSAVQSESVSLNVVLSQGAAQLTGLAPPKATSDYNKDLAASLAGLATRVEDIGTSATSSHSVCAGSSALATLTTSYEADSLRGAATELLAVSSDYVFGKFLPAATQGTNRRLANGQQLKKASGGSGQLTAENQGDTDALLTLAADGANSATAVFYVQAGQKTTVKGIKDGSYHVYIASGTDWDSNLKEFTVSCKTTENTDAMAFTTTRSTYSAWTLTFGIATGGTDPLTPVDPSQVPA